MAETYDKEAGGTNSPSQTGKKRSGTEVHHISDGNEIVVDNSWHAMRNGLQAIFTEGGDSNYETNGVQGGVMDTGATCGVIPRATAEALGLPITPETEQYGIRFGNNATVRATHCVWGLGFIDRLAVIPDAAATLIPIRSWTQRGLRVVFTRRTMTVYPPQGSRILYQCSADPASDLYIGDLKQLLGLPRETLTRDEERPARPRPDTAYGLSDDMETSGDDDTCRDDEDEETDTDEVPPETDGDRSPPRRHRRISTSQSSTAAPTTRKRHQPRWTAGLAEIARRLHTGSGHGNFATLQEIFRHGCWDGIPAGIDFQQLLGDVARKLPCILCRLAKDRHMDRPLGTGIHPRAIGAIFSFDVIGPFAPLTLYRARYVMIFVDLATGWEYGLLTDAKDATTLISCGRQLATVNKSYGHKLEALRCDAGKPETSAEYERAMAQMDSGVRILPAAVRNQRANPVERRVQDQKREVALEIAGQTVLDGAYWGLAYLDVIGCRNKRPNTLTREFSASATPQELNEGRRPRFQEAACGLAFGMLGISPTGEVKPKIGTLANELRVYVGRHTTDSNAVLTVEAPPTRNMTPAVTRDFKPLYLRGATVDQTLQPRICTLDDDENGTIQVNVIDHITPQLPMERGLLQPTPQEVHDQATAILQQAHPSPAFLLNAGDPATTAKGAGTISRNTRAYTRSRKAAEEAETASTEGQEDSTMDEAGGNEQSGQLLDSPPIAQADANVHAAVRYGLDDSATSGPGTSGTSNETAEVTIAELVHQCTPSGWQPRDFYAYYASAEALMDAEVRDELAPTLEEELTAPAARPLLAPIAETTLPAYKAHKTYTADCPSYQTVMRSPELRAKRLPEVRKHMQQLVDDYALEKMPNEVRRHAVRIVRWMMDLRTKYNPDGSFDKLKARWNLRGDLIKREDDKLGLQVNSYAATLKMHNLRRLVAMHAYYGHKDWTLKSLDVSSAFSGTDSTREQLLYVELPDDIMQSPGHEPATDIRETASNDRTSLYQVNASHHGLAEASHDFAQEVIAHARSAGLRQTSGDRALLYWRPDPPRPGACVAMGLITDDMPQLYGDDAEAAAVMQRVDDVIEKRWTVTRQTVMRKAIGIQVTYNDDGSTTLKSPRHIEDLRGHCYPDINGDSTPTIYGALPTEYAKTAGWDDDADEEVDQAGQDHFRSAVGLMSYILHTRPLDQVAYSWLSGRTGRATAADICAMRHFAAYAHTTREVGVTYHPRGTTDPSYPQIIVAPDAAYRRHPGGQSQLGVGVKLGGVDSPSGFIDWISRKERGAPSLSVPEAETKAHVEGTKMAIDHRLTSEELGDVQDGPTIILEDNDTVRNNIMETAGKPSAMRHAAQLLNFCTYHTRNGTTQTQRVAGTRQPGDGLTKLFGPTDHWRAAIHSMGWSQPLEDISNRVRRLYGRPHGHQRDEERVLVCVEDRNFEEIHGGKQNRQLSAWQIQRQRDDEESEEEAMDDVAYVIDRERAERAKRAAINSNLPSNAGEAYGTSIRADFSKRNRAKTH